MVLITATVAAPVHASAAVLSPSAPVFAAAGRPPARPSPGTSGNGTFAVDGGNKDAGVDVWFLHATVKVTIDGDFPCDEGGTVRTLLVLRAPGSGNANGGAFSATFEWGSISGSLSKTGNPRHPYHISGTYRYAIPLDDYGDMCTGQASFSGDDCGRGCPRLIADAGGPYDVVRGGYVRLDASKSVGDITKYTWTFRLASSSGSGSGEGGGPVPIAPPRLASSSDSGSGEPGGPLPGPVSVAERGAGGDDPAAAPDDGDSTGSDAGACVTGGSQLAPYTGHGKVTSIQVLCPLTVTLTETARDGETADDETQIGVKARDWKTPTPDYRWIGSALVAGTGDRFGEPRSGRDFIASQNECPDGRNKSAFCLPCKDGQVGPEPCAENFAAAYDPATIRKGPFKGWHYASEAKLKVKRIGVLNPYLTLNGKRPDKATQNFYHANLAQCPQPWLLLSLLPDDDPAAACSPQPVGAWLKALEEHEGIGDGQPVSGHEQLFDEAIHLINPDQYLERDVGTSESELSRRNARCLDDAADKVWAYGDSNLVPVSGLQPRYLRLWNPTVTVVGSQLIGRWVSAGWIQEDTNPGATRNGIAIPTTCSKNATG